MSILGLTEFLCTVTGLALSAKAVNTLRDSTSTGKKRAKMELALGLGAIAFPLLSRVLNPYLFPKFKVEYSCTGPIATMNPETNCATMINEFGGPGGYNFQPGLTDTNGKLECRFSLGAEACKHTLEEAFKHVGISNYNITLIS